MTEQYNYSEKLQHPLWQKKRLDILNRGNFTCEICKDKDTTLHVHHVSYTYGKNPWEYDDNNFQCLCKHCHGILENYKPSNILSISKTKINENDIVMLVVIHDNQEGYFLAVDNYKDGILTHNILIERSTILQVEYLFKKSERLVTKNL